MCFPSEVGESGKAGKNTARADARGLGLDDGGKQKTDEQVKRRVRHTHTGMGGMVHGARDKALCLKLRTLMLRLCIYASNSRRCVPRHPQASESQEAPPTDFIKTHFSFKISWLVPHHRKKMFWHSEGGLWGCMTSQKASVRDSVRTTPHLPMS